MSTGKVINIPFGVTNLDTSPCKVSTYITYYEGEISILN